MVQQALPSLSRLRRSGFTLIEILIVVAIIAILMAILLPVLTGGRDKARRVMEASQIQSIAAAAESYSGAYRSYPGYYTEATVWENHEDITSTENLVISLLGGGTSVDDVANPFANPERIGFGPSVRDMSGNMRIVDAFYNPKDNELGLAQGGRWSDNDIPELLGLWSGQPILYWRASAGTNVAVMSDHNPPVELYWHDHGEGPRELDLRPAFSRRVNANFTESSGLSTPLRDTAIDQANNSLLSDIFYQNVVGLSDDQIDVRKSPPNHNLAAFLSHQGRSNPSNNEVNGMFFNVHNGPNKKGALKGGFVLMSSGGDGVYLNHEDAGEEGVTRDENYKLLIRQESSSVTNWGVLDQFDDQVLVTGRTPD